MEPSVFFQLVNIFWQLEKFEYGFDVDDFSELLVTFIV